MPKADHVVDPVAAGAGYCQCGYYLPPGRARPTMLWVACHRAHHLAWLKPRSLKEWKDLAAAQTIAIAELAEAGAQLRRDVADRDDRIEQLEADLDFVHRQEQS